MANTNDNEDKNLQANEIPVDDNKQEVKKLNGLNNKTLNTLAISEGYKDKGKNNQSYINFLVGLDKGYIFEKEIPADNGDNIPKGKVKIELACDVFYNNKKLEAGTILTLESEELNKFAKTFYKIIK